MRASRRLQMTVRGSVPAERVDGSWSQIYVKLTTRATQNFLWQLSG
jgi:hypothetical protein